MGKMRLVVIMLEKGETVKGLMTDQDIEFVVTKVNNYHNMYSMDGNLDSLFKVVMHDDENGMRVDTYILASTVRGMITTEEEELGARDD